MVLFIKNMVCRRCILAVTDILERMGLLPQRVELGEAILGVQDMNTLQREELERELRALGFELADDRRSRIIEQIKNLVVETIHYREEPVKVKYSEYISKHLHYDYSYLSKLFSDVEGITIEQYIIRQRIERVKELLVYDELSLEEIAFKTGYSSAAHLSGQFKKITGLSSSHFKTIGKQKRRALDQLSGTEGKNQKTI